MRRVLLTPSQVSILVTSVVVVSCTVALFLSGYAIQQRTVRNLRSAIRPREPRPRPAPQMYLPEQFQSERQQEDGPLVGAEGEVGKDTSDQPAGQVVEVEETVPDNKPDERNEAATGEKIAMVEALKAQAAQKSWAVEHPDPLVKNKAPITKAERRRLIKEEIQRLSKSDEHVYYQRRLW